MHIYTSLALSPSLWQYGRSVCSFTFSKNKPSVPITSGLLLTALQVSISWRAPFPQHLSITCQLYSIWPLCHCSVGLVDLSSCVRYATEAALNASRTCFHRPINCLSVGLKGLSTNSWPSSERERKWVPTIDLKKKKKYTLHSDAVSFYFYTTNLHGPCSQTQRDLLTTVIGIFKLKIFFFSSFIETKGISICPVIWFLKLLQLVLHSIYKTKKNIAFF